MIQFLSQNVKLVIIAILVFLISMSVGMLVTRDSIDEDTVLPHSRLENNLILVDPSILPSKGQK